MMKLSEILFLAMVITGLILKFTIIIAGSLVFVPGILLLCLLYFPLGFAYFNSIPISKIFTKSSYNGLSFLRLTFTLLMGFCLSLIPIGFLFKLQHFPGAKIMLFIGLYSELMLMVIAGIQWNKFKKTFYKRALIRLGSMVILGFMIVMTSDISIERFQFRNHPEYLKTFERYLENPDNAEYQYRLEVERSRIFYTPEQFKAMYPNEK